ncbi:uncharacterized protein LOC125945171 isoform X2 [Dermacentor silvarum]|uniref:uncharacterized protein LOC125945171 isoform X2 n=1 Tax=Dermacentor silvarum TaxID=543639 RepID=UPI00210121ED|nr:uncharacterized protein LOC125945171 isoform X2 [Dermacentor silvarum]
MSVVSTTQSLHCCSRSPGSDGAPAGSATTKVANKSVQAGCVVCDPLPEIIRRPHIIVEGVEPVRRSSLRSSDSTSASPESGSSSKKSVSFSIGNNVITRTSTIDFRIS